MMETQDACTKKIISNSDSPKIYRPKPKKLCITYKSQKSSQNIKKNGGKKLFPLSPVSSTNYNIKRSVNEQLKTNNVMKSNVNKKHKFDFEEISLKEIENDFSLLKAKSEVIKAENELIYLLRSSTKENSFDDECKEVVKIKRPKNPFLESLE